MGLFFLLFYFKKKSILSLDSCVRPCLLLLLGHWLPLWCDLCSSHLKQEARKTITLKEVCHEIFQNQLWGFDVKCVFLFDFCWYLNFHMDLSFFKLKIEFKSTSIKSFSNLQIIVLEGVYCSHCRFQAAIQKSVSTYSLASCLASGFSIPSFYIFGYCGY